MQRKLRTSFLLIAAVALLSFLTALIMFSPPAALAESILHLPSAAQLNPLPDAGLGDHDAMHDACASGDWNTMEREMDRVHPDWRSHHGSGTHMSAGWRTGGPSGWSMMGRSRTAWGMMESGGMVW